MLKLKSFELISKYPELFFCWAAYVQIKNHLYIMRTCNLSDYIRNLGFDSAFLNDVYVSINLLFFCQNLIYNTIIEHKKVDKSCSVSLVQTLILWIKGAFCVCNCNAIDWSCNLHMPFGPTFQ